MSKTKTLTTSRYDVDTYLNPYIPRPRLDVLPRIVSRFLGYRPQSSPVPNPPHTLIIWLWCFIGAFCGVAIIEASYKAISTLDDRTVPIVIASFGAAAILEYNTIESPLSQPRNLVFGHFLSAIVGVGITKLFALLPPEHFNSLRWLAGALSVGAASVVMSATKTVHPPAGATALLASTSPDVTALGWWLLPLILLGSSLMLGSACLLNNISRRFPMFWWTPVDLAQLHAQRKPQDLEKAVSQVSQKAPSLSSSGTLTIDDKSTLPSKPIPAHVQARLDEPTDSSEKHVQVHEEHEIAIAAECITVPSWLRLDDWEIEVLQIIQERVASGPSKSSNVEAGRT